jgi:hypothetical protein
MYNTYIYIYMYMTKVCFDDCCDWDDQKLLYIYILYNKKRGGGKEAVGDMRWEGREGVLPPLLRLG